MTHLVKINQQIKDQVDAIINLIANIDFNISALEQFYKDLTANELLIFDKYQLLEFLKISLWNSAILNLCILFNSEEDFGLVKLINTLINNFKRVNFKEKVTIQDLTLLLEQINHYNGSIKKLKVVRDKAISHKDHSQEFSAILLSELRVLTDIAQSVFNKIFTSLYSSDFDWDQKYDKHELSLIKNLANFEKLRLTISKAEICKKRAITINELLTDI